MVVTEHAIQRYIERIEPGLGPKGAEVKIRRYLKEATALQGPTVEMMKRWPKSSRRNSYLIHELNGIVFVLSRRGKRRLVVTVLQFSQVLMSAKRIKSDVVRGLQPQSHISS